MRNQPRKSNKIVKWHGGWNKMNIKSEWLGRERDWFLLFLLSNFYFERYSMKCNNNFVRTSKNSHKKALTAASQICRNWNDNNSYRAQWLEFPKLSPHFVPHNRKIILGALPCRWTLIILSKSDVFISRYRRNLWAIANSLKIIFRNFNVSTDTSSKRKGNFRPSHKIAA